MSPEELKKVLSDHRDWLADSSTNLRAYLPGADLHEVDLQWTTLPWADLHEADLRNAHLCAADFREANLQGANLQGANLRGANLQGANLRGANLRGADLQEAILQEAILRGTNLRGALLPSPTMVLLAEWGKLPKELTQRAMAYDAAAHPDPSAFDRWAAGGDCPYKGERVQRACHFNETKSLWDPTVPAPRAFDLMVDLIREVCLDSDFHQK